LVFRVDWLQHAVGELAQLSIGADSPFQQAERGVCPRGTREGKLGTADGVLDAIRKSGFPATILPTCPRRQNRNDPQTWAPLITAFPSF